MRSAVGVGRRPDAGNDQRRQERSKEGRNEP